MAGFAKESTNRQRNTQFLSALLDLGVGELDAAAQESGAADSSRSQGQPASEAVQPSPPPVGAFPAALLAAMSPEFDSPAPAESQAPTRSLGSETWASPGEAAAALSVEPEADHLSVQEPEDALDSPSLEAADEELEAGVPAPAMEAPMAEAAFAFAAEDPDPPSQASGLEAFDEAWPATAAAPFDPEPEAEAPPALTSAASDESEAWAAEAPPLAWEPAEEAPSVKPVPMTRSLGWSDEPAASAEAAPTSESTSQKEPKKGGRSPLNWLKSLAPKKLLGEKAPEAAEPEVESWTIEDSWTSPRAEAPMDAPEVEPAPAEPAPALSIAEPPPILPPKEEKPRFDWSQVQPAAPAPEAALPEPAAEAPEPAPMPPADEPAELTAEAPEPGALPAMDWCGLEISTSAGDEPCGEGLEDSSQAPVPANAEASQPIFSWSSLISEPVEAKSLDEFSTDEARGRLEPEPDLAAEPPALILTSSEEEEVPGADQLRAQVPTVFAATESVPDNMDLSTAKNFRWKRLGALLVDLGIISNDQLAEALQLQKQERKPLGQTLVDHGFITQNLLLRTLAAQFDVELWDLESAEPSAMVARMLPEALCREKTMIAVARREDGIVLAMKNPADLETLEEVKRLTGIEAIPALAAVERIESAIAEIFNPIAQMKAMQERSGLEVNRGDDLTFTTTVEPDGSVVEMVDDLMEMCIKMKVSDIHIEPREKMVEVRVRLDGQLIKIKEYSKEIAPMLTARFKILAEVDLVEWRIPQDGRISVKCDGRIVDMRVSILPSLYGQRIVMRLLDKSNALRKLEELGFSQHNLQIFRKLINRPYGLFLVTGPTGSGKTTTLYAALNEIRKPTNNVMTCEDPVEYDIHGINQSQVNEKVGLTFGAQLRAILRQDPDIVLIGEIRDRETAEIAIKAAMTGHMVLSTLHTNDAPGALPRLLDMGVDAANLSTALVGTMGQRLIRRLCRNCAADSAPTQEEVELLENSFGSSDLATIWRAVGCPKCHDQGYKGRMAIHEIMPVSSETAELIQQKAPVERIRETVRYYGYRTMQEDALDRIRDGVTSLDEAKRILSFDDIPRMEDPEAYYKKLQKAS